MVELGFVMLVVLFLKLVLGDDEMNEVYVGFSVLFFLVVYMIIIIEWVLKKNFLNDV